MFTLKEGEGYLTAFTGESLTEPFEVYVDGSFNGDAKLLPRGATTMPVASGWAISTGNGELAGYGGSDFIMDYTNMSEKGELASILSFLDAMQENFPGFISRDFPVTLVSDNQNLITNINAALVSEETSRYCYRFHGENYVRLLYYMSVMDLKFSWVKGHSINDFNRLADFIARRAYQSIRINGEYTAEERRDFSRYLVCQLNMNKRPFNQKLQTLSFRQLRNEVSRNGVEVLTELPTLWIGTKTAKHDGRTFSSFAFTDSDLEVQGYRGGVFLKEYDDFYLGLRAINYAIEQYLENGFSGNSLLIRTDNEKASALINNFQSKKWKSYRKDDAFDQEIQKLTKFKEALNLISFEVSDGKKAYSKISSMEQNSSYIAENSQRLMEELLASA